MIGALEAKGDISKLWIKLKVQTVAWSYWKDMATHSGAVGEIKGLWKISIQCNNYSKQFKYNVMSNFNSV